MINIKNYLKYLSIILLCLLSFYYTEKVALYVKSNNPLIKTITNIKDSKYVSSINSTIIDNKYIIPGLSGKEVNIDKSFSNMHANNIYNESYLVFNEIKPKISIEDNKDKIIIRGNKAKQSVSLIFENINKLSEYLYNNNYKVNLLIKEEINTNKYELINNSQSISNYNKIESFLDKNNLNKNICYIKEDNMIKEYCNNKYLFKPSLIISHSNISTKINSITSGDIILLKDTLTITELKLILNQISYRNLNIIPLSELIME